MPFLTDIDGRASRALTARFGVAAVSQLPAADSRAVARTLFRPFASTPEREPMIEAAMTAVPSCAARRPSRTGLWICDWCARWRTSVRIPWTRWRSATWPVQPHCRRAASATCSSHRPASFRAYLPWLCINLAVEAVMAGSSWTDAAHEAGFADSAHLTRTQEKVFGIEPSALRPMTPERRAT